MNFKYLPVLIESKSSLYYRYIPIKSQSLLWNGINNVCLRGLPNEIQEVWNCWPASYATPQHLTGLWLSSDPWAVLRGVFTQAHKRKNRWVPLCHSSHICSTPTSLIPGMSVGHFSPSAVSYFSSCCWCAGVHKLTKAHWSLCSPWWDKSPLWLL